MQIKTINSFEQSFFMSVKRILHNNSINYQESENNVYMSLLRKEFATSVKSNKPQKENPDYIHWREYLDNYLYKQSNLGVPWADKWSTILDSEHFLLENKYQSWLFYHDFYLRTVPRCLLNEEDKTERWEKIPRKKSEINNHRETTKSIENKNTNQVYNDLSLTSNLGGSFLSMNTSDLADDDPNMIYKQGRIKVKEYIKEIKDHLFSNKDHPMVIVINSFSKVFTEYITECIKKINQSANDINTYQANVKDVSEEVTKQWQKFIIKIQKALMLFYCQSMDYECFGDEKDELMNLITGLVFKTGQIYERMYELYSLSCESIIKGLEMKCHKLKKVKPEELGIQDKFCLNEKTLKLQKKILLDKKKERETKAEVSEKNENLKNDNQLISIIETKMENMVDDDNDNNILMSNQIDEIGEDDSDENENENDDDYVLDEKHIEKNNQSKAFRVSAEPLKESKFIEQELSENHFEEGNKSKQDLSWNGWNGIEDIGHNEGIKSNNDFFNNPITNSMDQSGNASDKSYNTNSKGKPKKEYNFKKKDLLNNIYNPLNLPRYSECSPSTTQLHTLLKAPKTNFNIVRDTITRKNENIAQALMNKQVPLSYTSAIRLLKSVKKFKTPFEKMMIIASISDEITECISDFWSDLSTYIKNSFLGIESEELMIIFLFILIKSQMPEIAIHAKMIKNFTTSTTRGTMIGYYYTTLEATIAYLEEVKDQKDLIKKEELNQARWSVLNWNKVNRYTTFI